MEKLILPEARNGLKNTCGIPNDYFFLWNCTLHQNKLTLFGFLVQLNLFIYFDYT